jgi:hypothetical protein
MAGFSAFLEAKVLNRSSGIFSNFGAEKPPLRQAAGTVRGHALIINSFHLEQSEISLRIM